jgi:hypothetical protein
MASGSPRVPLEVLYGNASVSAGPLSWRSTAESSRHQGVTTLWFRVHEKYGAFKRLLRWVAFTFTKSTEPPPLTFMKSTESAPFEFTKSTEPC